MPSAVCWGVQAHPLARGSLCAHGCFWTRLGFSLSHFPHGSLETWTCFLITFISEWRMQLNIKIFQFCWHDLGGILAQVVLFSMGCFSFPLMVTGSMRVHEEGEWGETHCAWCQPVSSAGVAFLSPSSHPSSAASAPAASVLPELPLVCSWNWKKTPNLLHLQ